MQTDEQGVGASRPDASEDYGRLAPHVAAVLEVAAEAGEQIRVKAEGEAEQILRGAREDAARLRDEAAALKAETQSAVTTKQQRAEEYAERRRKDADTEALKILQHAQKIADEQHRALAL